MDPEGTTHTHIVVFKSTLLYPFTIGYILYMRFSRGPLFLIFSPKKVLYVGVAMDAFIQGVPKNALSELASISSHGSIPSHQGLDMVAGN